jgi:hypothetical protein
MNLRKHKCLDCGYLCHESHRRHFIGNAASSGQSSPQFEYETDYVELTVVERNKFNAKNNSGGFQLYCYRHDTVFHNVIQNIKGISDNQYAKNIDNLVQKPSKCFYFIKHISGYSASQHLTRWEAIDRESSNRNWSIVYILLGALLTLIATIVVRLVFPTP